MKNTDLYVKALKAMPKNFTSHYFTRKLRELGVTDYEISYDYYYNFLIEECVKVKKLHWEKKPKIAQVESTQLTIPTRRIDLISLYSDDDGLSDEQMIERLKAKGYKVLKQKWDEI